MARFNLKPETTKGKKTINRANGLAFEASNEYRLVSLALTSFVTDQYYRTANTQLQELLILVESLDPEFVAKTAVFARRECGMRSVSHVIAAMLSSRASGHPWAKAFYDQIVLRPDDMLEIYAAYQAFGGDHLTNAMKKGFAAALGRFDAYQLAKYQGKNRTVKLVDMVNLVHPDPSAKNAEALSALVMGTLKNTKTWEAKLSALGRENLDEKTLAKKKYWIWAKLLNEGKLGYLALLRNLRNILRDAPGLANKVHNQLTDPYLIRKSRVLPFRILTAYKQLNRSKASKRRVLKGLRRAMDIACDNMPVMENTLVVIDNSASMSQPVSGSEHLLCNEVAALFGIAMAKKCNADIMEFGSTARLIPYEPHVKAIDFAIRFGENNEVGY